MRARAHQREGRRRRDGRVFAARAATPLARVLHGRRRILLRGLRGRAALLAHQGPGTTPVRASDMFPVPNSYV